MEEQWNKLTLTQKRNILSVIVKHRPYTNDNRVVRIIDIINREILKAKKEVFDNLIADWTELNKRHRDGNKAFAEIGKLIRGKRHLSTSQSEGTELSFKVPSQSSDKGSKPSSLN